MAIGISMIVFTISAFLFFFVFLENEKVRNTICEIGDNEGHGVGCMVCTVLVALLIVINFIIFIVLSKILA